MEQTLCELMEQLSKRKDLDDARRQARLLDWFADRAKLYRHDGESDESLANRIKEVIARDAMKEALREE